MLNEKNAETIYRMPVTNVKLSLMTRMTMTQRLSPMLDELLPSEALHLPMQFEVRAFLYLIYEISNLVIMIRPSQKAASVESDERR